MRALVVGATGQVGRRLTERLLARGDAVRVLVAPEAWEDVLHRTRLELVAAAPEQRAASEAALEDVDVVFDLGSPLEDDGLEVGLGPARTKELVAGAARQGVQRYIYLSSVAVYAPAPRPWMWPIREDWPLLAHGHEALRRFGQDKIEGEQLVQQAAATDGLEFAIMRSSAAYGPRVRWLEGLLRGLAMTPLRGLVPEPDPAYMQWVNVRDLADALVLAGANGAPANAPLNVASDELITRRDIARVLVWLEAGLPPALDTAGTPVLLKYDIGAAHRLIGFEPVVRLAEGLSEAVSTMTYDGLGRGRSWRSW
jgi:nucleoside-diphosphate-sugar epimerase